MGKTWKNKDKKGEYASVDKDQSKEKRLNRSKKRAASKEVEEKP